MAGTGWSRLVEMYHRVYVHIIIYEIDVNVIVHPPELNPACSTYEITEQFV